MLTVIARQFTRAVTVRARQAGCSVEDAHHCNTVIRWPAVAAVKFNHDHDAHQRCQATFTSCQCSVASCSSGCG
jgi:hypothetical protein